MRLKAIFKNPKRVLWPNQFVKARLLLRTQKDAVVVPSLARFQQRGPKRGCSCVYVVAADQTVSDKAVQVESVQGDLSLIKSGLEPGQLVVVDGQNQLRPGSKVATRVPDKATLDQNGRSSPRYCGHLSRPLSSERSERSLAKSRP